MTNSEMQIQTQTIRYVLVLDFLQALTIQQEKALLAIAELGKQIGKTEAEIKTNLQAIGINGL
jgi:hypothetical protein